MEKFWKITEKKLYSIFRTFQIFSKFLKIMSRLKKSPRNIFQKKKIFFLILKPELYAPPRPAVRISIIHQKKEEKRREKKGEKACFPTNFSLHHVRWKWHIFMPRGRILKGAEPNWQENEVKKKKEKKKEKKCLMTSSDEPREGTAKILSGGAKKKEKTKMEIEF